MKIKAQGVGGRQGNRVGIQRIVPPIERSKVYSPWPAQLVCKYKIAGDAAPRAVEGTKPGIQSSIDDSQQRIIFQLCITRESNRESAGDW